MVEGDEGNFGKRRQCDVRDSSKGSKRQCDLSLSSLEEDEFLLAGVGENQPCQSL